MSRDLNDRAIAGDLPIDLKDICEPFNDAAKDWDFKNPRIRNVVELLQSSLSRTLSHEKPKALTTGNYKIDYMTGGIRPGFVWVLGAETSWGKSTYIVSIADINMDLGARVLIVSTEDPETVYGDRLMARRSRVSARRLRDRCLNPEEQKLVTQVVADAKPIPVFMDARGVPVEKLVVQLNYAIAKHKIDLVCIDYLQEVQVEHSFQDERVKFKWIGSQLRNVIKGNNIAGIIASQITVPDGKKIPDKHSIRETRDVPNAAEVVALGYIQAETYHDEAKELHIEKDAKVIKIDKAKDGEKCITALDWDTHSATFKRQLRPVSKEDEKAAELQRFIGFVPDNEDPLDAIPPLDPELREPQQTEFSDWVRSTYD